MPVGLIIGIHSAMEPRAACACPVSAMRRRPWLLAMCAYPQDILLTPQRCLPHNFHLNSGRCSKSFRLLTADQCAACLRGGLASGDLGTQCDACGRLYPFLQESPCGICRQYDNDLGAAVDQAFHNAPNPRAHKAALPQVRTREASEMDIIEAEQVHQTMRNSYHHAVGSSAGGPLQGPKVPSVPFGAKASRSATSKVVMLFLKVTKFQVRWAAGGVKGPNFTLIPYGKMYPLSSPFSEIEENIRTEVDSQLAGLHVLNRRLMSDDDITLMYELPKTKIDPSLTRGTLGDLWYNTIRADNIDHVISKSHVASRTLNLHAHIILCGEKVDTETGTTLANHSQKRKATLSMSTPNGTQLVPAAKARALDTVSRHRYDTTLNVATAYTVVRTTCSMESDGSTTLIQADEPFEVMVNDNKSASGTTKNMFRLAYNESVYAAKCFYNIGLGSQPPTASENAEALQKELIVLTVAQSLCDTFIDRAKALKIGIADIRVSQSALFTVTSGERKGHAWLVDPMLPTTTISKFSGTNHAGANSKLLGYTCDALAHFSLMESDATLVLVDIQGIRVPKTVQGVSGTDDLVLLDLMTHTRTGMSGIGDRGFPGIKDFAQQHACNTLCSNLRLTSCEDILDAAIEADEGLRHLRHNSPGLGPGESASEIASQLLRAHPSNSDDSSTNDDADLKRMIMPSIEFSSGREITIRETIATTMDGQLCAFSAALATAVVVIENGPSKRLGPYSLARMTKPNRNSNEGNKGSEDWFACTIPGVDWGLFRRDACEDSCFFRLLIRNKEDSDHLSGFQYLAAQKGVPVPELRFTSMMVAEDCESHQRWLCFPATKSTQVKHVTGYSIEHGDAIAATLHAFSHYTLVSSSSDFDTATDHDSLFSEPDERVASVCTDICYFLGDDGIPIVFDTITHSDTLPGEAWRDLGADGVENFQRKHVCNQVCVDLELKDMKIVA